MYGRCGLKLLSAKLMYKTDSWFIRYTDFSGRTWKFLTFANIFPHARVGNFYVNHCRIHSKFYLLCNNISKPIYQLKIIKDMIMNNKTITVYSLNYDVYLFGFFHHVHLLHFSFSSYSGWLAHKSRVALLLFLTYLYISVMPNKNHRGAEGKSYTTYSADLATPSSHVRPPPCFI